jgi:TM2 domain-containing membrane protein YozV
MQEPVAHREVNVWAAVVLSLVFPGLGQIYVGEKMRSAVYVAAGLIALGTVIIQTGIIIYPLLLFVSAIDVRSSARRINGENGDTAQVSPENGRRPLERDRPAMVARDGKANS